MNIPAFLLLSSLMLVLPTPAWTITACADHAGPLHALGVLRLSLPKTATDAGDALFAAPPRVLQVRGDGTAFGTLQKGDLLLSIDGHAITSPAAAAHYASIKPGDSVRLTVKRRDSLRAATVIAGERCSHD